MMSDKNDEDQGLSFEAALAELETIVSKLEGGRVSLDESIALYEKGARLRRLCEDKLRAAEARIDLIVQTADGMTTRPLDATSG